LVIRKKPLSPLSSNLRKKNWLLRFKSFINLFYNKHTLRRGVYRPKVTASEPTFGSFTALVWFL
jgi:hypothetical protein